MEESPFLLAGYFLKILGWEVVVCASIMDNVPKPHTIYDVHRC